MKNAEGSDLPLELERRLKAGVDQLRKMTDSLEGLVQVADAVGPMLGVARKRGRGRPASRPAAGGQEGRGTAATPPARQLQTHAAKSAPAQAAEEEIPEWRKLFPGLAAEVPHRKGKG